jgi:hypothetical protein
VGERINRDTGIIGYVKNGKRWFQNFAGENFTAELRRDLRRNPPVLWHPVHKAFHVCGTFRVFNKLVSVIPGNILD